MSPCRRPAKADFQMRKIVHAVSKGLPRMARRTGRCDPVTLSGIIAAPGDGIEEFGESEGSAP